MIEAIKLASNSEDKKRLKFWTKYENKDHSGRTPCWTSEGQHIGQSVATFSRRTDQTDGRLLALTSLKMMALSSSCAWFSAIRYHPSFF